MIDKITLLIHKFLSRSVRNRFSGFYRNNAFEGVESRSGNGSSMIQTETIRKKLPELLEQLRIESMVDAPCGDLRWISKVELPVRKYIGIDIVEELIQKNQEKYKNDQQSFLVRNIICDELPGADIILCRDCLVHLSYSQCFAVVRNFKKSRSKYLLTTTFTERKKNEDLRQGIWRVLNLEISPFNFPKPIKIINEKCTEINGDYKDKCLALWLLDDIEIK